jgi:hypothetical protein
VAYRGDHTGAARDFRGGFLFAAVEAVVETKSRSSFGKLVSALAIWHSVFSRLWSDPSGSSSASVTWAARDPLYFIDSNSIDLCNLLPRHPVARQGADATVLGSRYLAGLMPDRRPPPYLLLIGWCFDLRCTHRHLRRDCEDPWLAPGLLLSRRRGICGGCWRVSTYGLLTWLEQVFSELANSVDPLTIIESIRRLPFGSQELLQRKLLTGK